MFNEQNIHLYSGTVFAELSTHDDHIVICGWSSNNPGYGNTMGALRELKTQNPDKIISASGIGSDPSDPSWQYWEKMASYGLVDKLTDDEETPVHFEKNPVSIKLNELIIEFLDPQGDEKCDSTYDINTGWCGDFAFYAYERLDIEDVEIMGDFDFVEYTERYSSPPGMDWNRFFELGLDEALSHSWIVVDNKHYDAEHLGGVSSPFDLRANRVAMVEHLAMNHLETLRELLVEPWWKESQSQCKHFLAWHDRKHKMNHSKKLDF